MTAVIRNEFVVGCTPEQAFDFLSDLRNELKWNPGECESVEKITDGPVGVGTRYRARWKGGPESEVVWVAFERPHSWQAHGDGALESRFSCRVEPHAEGAKVVSELELIPHGFVKLLFPLIKRGFIKENKATPDKIRRALREHWGDEQAAA